MQPRTTPPNTPVTLQNPSFESGSLTGWTLTNDPVIGNWIVNSHKPYQGSFNLLVNTDQGDPNVTFLVLNNEQPLCSEGTLITATGAVRLSEQGYSEAAVVIAWYDIGGVQIGDLVIGTTFKRGVDGLERWFVSNASGVAPAGTASVRIGFRGICSNDGDCQFDALSWNYNSAAPQQGLIYKAVQAGIGTSGSTEPVWPPVNGQTVVDNTVTWEAVLMSRVVWKARSILRSGATEPTWPTVVGDRVSDNTISWEAATRQATEAPNSKVVAITASKVFADDGDIIRYSATVNPLDWTSQDNAGYLPSGLNQNGSNHTAVLNIYRSNLVGFSSSTFQNWQVDEDPANMELLDVMEGIGSTWQQAAQPVARDLFYLAALGVRTVGISGGSLNLVNGDVGMPIDPLVRESIKAAVADESEPRGMYYPSLGQYMLAFPVDSATTTTYAYSMSTLGEVGAWSVYEYPWPVEAHAMLGNDLYLRSGDSVFRIDPDRLHDQDAAGEDVEVIGEIQSHYLDMGSPAVTKMLIGVDLVGNGVARISLGFNQTNLAYFTADATVPADTVPGNIIPIPLAAPSFAMRIRYSSMDNPNGWEWLASSFYVNDFRPAT